MRFMTVALALAITCIPSGSLAQTAPISRTVPVVFTGVVSQSPAETIMVRQPDGRLASFAGDLPALPYAQGDPVTISFNATLPTREFYDSGVYRGQIAADGIYRITVSSPRYNGGTAPGGIGNSTIADISGAINDTDNFGQPTNTLMTIVYDYNTDSYSIEGGGRFLSSAYSSPGYIYDAATGSFVACTNSISCRVSALTDPVISAFSAGSGNSATTVQSGNFRIHSTDPSSGTGQGFFSWLFSGSWNLPQFSGDGGTQVPEPGMLGLFGGALAILALGRRRSRRTGR